MINIVQAIKPPNPSDVSLRPNPSPSGPSPKGRSSPRPSPKGWVRVRIRVSYIVTLVWVRVTKCMTRVALNPKSNSQAVRLEPLFSGTCIEFYQLTIAIKPVQPPNMKPDENPHKRRLFC